MDTSEGTPEPGNDIEGPAVGESSDESAEQASHDNSADGVREDMVEKLLKDFHENQGNGAVGDFLGVEFSKDPPTEAERAEAYRRYVDDLAEHGASELKNGAQ